MTWLARRDPALLTNRQAMIGLLACVAAIRLGAFVAFRPVFDFVATGAIHGSGAYDMYARNLLATGVYGLTRGVPDAVLPPAYAAALAVVYRMVGRGALQVVLLNVALDLVACLMLQRIGERLFPQGRTVGTLGAACTAFYPYLVFQSLTVIDTSLFTALLYVLLALTVELRDARNRVTAWAIGALAGLVLGLALLTRPILAPLVLVVWWWLGMWRGWRPATSRLLPVVLAASVVVAPWVVRNARVVGASGAITTNGGSNLWQGNNPETVAYLQAGYDVQWIAPQPIAAPDPLGPDADRELFSRAIQYLWTHPAAIPALVWTKLLVHWSIDVAPGANPAPAGERGESGSAVTARADVGRGVSLSGLSPADPVATYSQPLFDRTGRLVHRFYWGTLFALGLCGLIVTRAAWRDVALVWSVPLTFTAVYVIFHPSTRYRAPADPAWFLFASAAIVWLLGHSRRGRARRTGQT